MSFLFNVNGDIFTEICGKLHSIKELCRWLATCTTYNNILKKGKWPQFQAYLTDHQSLDIIIDRFNFSNLSLNTSSLRLNKYIEYFGRCHTLNLGWCIIDDQFIIDLANITTQSSGFNIEDLNLSHCYHITDKSIKYIPLITSLKSLDLSHCQKVTDSSVKYLTSLYNLNITGCYRITDESIVSLSLSIVLKKLSIGQCQRVTDINIGKLTSLTFLDASYLIISDESISKLTNLTTINLTGSTVNKSVKNLVNIKNLNLTNNSGINKSIRELTHIHVLDLNGCLKISDTTVKMVVLNNIYLNTLILSGCYRITDDSVSIIAFHNNISKLNISGCSQITDVSMCTLMTGQVPLKVLNIRRCCNITGDGLLCIIKKDTLRELVLSDRGCYNGIYDIESINMNLKILWNVI